MKTEVKIKRELFGFEITQKSKSEMFSATDLVKAGNVWRAKKGISPFDHLQWFKNKTTQEFIVELEKKYGKVKISGRGRKSHTWVHPLLFIDLALAISPDLKIEVYEWLFDNLIKYRNDSGDSYLEMTAALYTRYSNKKEFPGYIQEKALEIKNALDVKDWQEASEDKLKKRNDIHKSIKLLSKVLTDTDQIVRIAIEENK